MKRLRVGVVGGGWAGMAAAVTAVQAGHHVAVFEAARQWGGRARALPASLADGSPVLLDNGQHILIGAYTDTLALMRTVGVSPQHTLLRQPLCMEFPDGAGLALPDWPVPLDVLFGIATAGGWSLTDKWSLLQTTSRWQRSGFRCSELTTVTTLCRGLSERVMQTLIEPLCVSALNTPPERSSGQVFLRVIQDALLGGRGSSNLLIPLTDLSSLFPATAAAWLAKAGAQLQLGCRVDQLNRAPSDSGPAWLINGEAFDTVIWATAPWVASHILGQAHGPWAEPLHTWARQTALLQYESIATVYVQAGTCRLHRPMLALPCSPDMPAQFVFDRGQLGGPTGLLAFVVSASQDERGILQDKVLRQAQRHLSGALTNQTLQPLQTVVEKRATFACTPGLVRPAQSVAPGLLACGDYVQGPYPATLEGAVRSGMAAARHRGNTT